MTKQQIEMLHNAGKMPDFAYYQLNGKTALENYIAQKKYTLTGKEKSELKIVIEESIDDILTDLF